MARIVDLTAHSGIYASRLMVESGHDVIRVEPPQGDAVRRLGPYLGGTPNLELGAFHLFLNAGKRSLTLNLDASPGRDIFLALVKTADAVVANVPLPLTLEEIAQANEKLAVVGVEDDTGPELCAYARSGLLAITGHPGKRPALLGGHIVYAATGLYVAVAMSAALYGRQRSGHGQIVKVSIRQCLETLAEQSMIAYAAEGKITQRRGYRGAITAVSGAFPTSDGYWMASMPTTPGRWAEFMEWVQDPVLKADKSLEDEAERLVKRDFILDRLEAWSRQFPKEQMVEEAQRRHIPGTPVAVPSDLAQDPQLWARGFFEEKEHEEAGRPVLSPRGAIGVVLGASLRPAPKRGQHNAEILRELGFSEAEHRALVESGAV